MQRGCLLICDNCGKKAIYVRIQESFCSFCREKLVIEDEMEDLVVALNNTNIITISSCVGYRENFENKRSYPHVVLLNSDDNIRRAEKVVAGYNQVKDKDRSSWKVESKECLLKREVLIIPEKTEKRLEDLHQDVKFLATHIVAFC